jgi:hypothetical protein
LQCTGGEAEVGLDDGKRNADHRHVERVEADDEGHGEEYAP